MELRGRWPLVVLGVAAVIYAVTVMAFVATSPDLRLRCLLVDNSRARNGIQIHTVPGLECQAKGPIPAAGDLLLSIGDQATANFFDFSQAMVGLHSLATPPGGLLDPGVDLSDLDDSQLPWLVEENVVGRRWVRVDFVSAATDTRSRAWLLIQPVPFGDIVLTLFWLIFQLGILGVAALAWWNRPFDRAARLFFVMSAVTLAGFVGGYHWHAIAGSLYLSLPMVACIALLPAVTLHFFLVYPRPKFPILAWPATTTLMIYLIPALAILGVAWTLFLGRVLTIDVTPEIRTARIEDLLGHLRTGIYAYLAIGGVYFFLTLFALVHSQLQTRNASEYQQVKWILRAGLVAAIPVGCTLWFAWFDRTEFAFGSARVLLFLASVSLMLAYAVAIVRHKLMLLDQIISRGMWYYVVSVALTVSVSLVIALAGVLDQLLRVPLSPQQSVAAGVILMLAVMLLLWVRDFGQRAVDRQFFREKYQLDRTLQRMNVAVGQLSDLEALTQLMLGSCRDVLRVERAAIYLRSSPEGPFVLMGAEQAPGQPLQFIPDEDFLAELKQEGNLQRVTPGTRSEMSQVQTDLRMLHADLVHALDSAQGVLGLVVLGEKKAGGSFNAEDLTYLHALGQITNVALQTARIKQDMARLNEDLRKKSEKIVEQSRQIAMLQSELTQSAESIPTEAPPPRPPEPDAADAMRREAVKGNSPAMVRVLETARKVASSESTVLIRGESGTGKELLAQLLHDNSPRHKGPMVRVHCAALSAGLLESELFGHVKGSFTGAHRDRVGRFEAANGGTLFLDEIGDISMETQIKLLRVLQERCFEPVGGSRTIDVDVRLITATHQDLEKLIADGRFREDLYYRLNVISLTLPPLRERREDVLELSIYFLGRAAARLSKRITHIDDDALGALERFPWPGNIRELENVIERAVVLAERDRITLRELPPEVAAAARELPLSMVETKPPSTAAGDRTRDVFSRPAAGGGNVASSSSAAPRPGAAPYSTANDDSQYPLRTTQGLTGAAAEREQLINALKQCDGNKAQAARLLGLARSTYFSKLKKHGIE